MFKWYLEHLCVILLNNLDVFQDLLRKPRAQVVIMFVEDQDINPLLSAVQRSSQGRRFRFIGSETWNDNKVNTIFILDM